MTQDVVRLWSELSCGTLTSSSSRRNCSWLLRALARARFEILQVAVMAPCGRDADGLTSFCERYREQPVPLDVGVARHSEKDASKRASMSRADVDSSAKLAPVLIRNCQVSISMDEVTWHDNSCT